VGEPPERVKALAFIGLLRHSKAEWAGERFRLLPWQRTMLTQLFGTRRPDGLRQYRTAYIEIPKKNGKSEIAAAIALYMLCGDDEPAGEIYSAAVDKDQASLVFQAAATMVQIDPELSRRIEVIESQRRMRYRPTNSVYRAIPADAPSAHGYNASAVIYDELHAAPNRDLWDVLTTSTGARRQPLTIVITTAGYDRQSICWQLHEYAVKIRDGAITDPTFLPIIYAAGPEDDWTDPVIWAKANPSLDQTIKRDYLEQECRRARELPGYQNTFKRLHLNLWTEQADRWLDLDVWDRGMGPGPEDATLAGLPCWGGLDLASTHDLTAFVLVWARDDGGYVVRPWFWLPAAGLVERARKDRVPYELWRDQGVLRVTTGNVTDYDVIREDLRELAEQYAIREIGFDRWNATQLVTQLQSDGAAMVAMGQGFGSLAAPTREVERLVLEGSLHHGGHPVLRWMVANAAVEQDAAGNRKPSKRKSRDRIDGVVALVMALGRAMVSAPAAEGGESAYASHRLLTV
jgi:phage terminase large subunit-like protein